MIFKVLKKEGIFVPSPKFELQIEKNYPVGRV